MDMVRVVGTLRDANGGQIVRLRYNPPPSPDSGSCGGNQTQRDADAEAVFSKRKNEFFAKTVPLSSSLESRDRLKTARGQGFLREVSSHIEKAVGAA